MRKIIKIILIALASFVAIFFLAKFATSFYDAKSPSIEKSFTVKKTSALRNIIMLSMGSDDSEDNLPEKINFLILGNPGEGNNAPNLTDTIMLATLKPQEQKIYFFSIPRDLYVRIGDSKNFSKINE